MVRALGVSPRLSSNQLPFLMLEDTRINFDGNDSVLSKVPYYARAGFHLARSFILNDFWITRLATIQQPPGSEPGAPPIKLLVN